VLLSPSFLLANAVWFGAETSVYTIMGQRQLEQGFTSTRVALMHKSGRSLVWSLAVCSGSSSVRVQRAIHTPRERRFPETAPRRGSRVLRYIPSLASVSPAG